MPNEKCGLDLTEFRQNALNWLISDEPLNKAQGVTNLQEAFLEKRIRLDLNSKISVPVNSMLPGRPTKPELIPPKALNKRSMRTKEGRAALIHALTHIEFNAINLALDAIWRFNNMPVQYYMDWLKVAAEEAYHFSLLNNHLLQLGYEYGSFTAHNALWELAESTQNDLLARMALVPRTMEARGLDVTPAIRNKLAQAGDTQAAEILDIILRDEIGHVEIGNHWFHWLCEQKALDPIETFQSLCQQYKAPKLRAPINKAARLAAGFSEEELLLMGSA